MGARTLNAILGLWLFFSPFLWRHTMTQRWNAWVVGFVAVTDVLVALSGEKLGRYLNAALGAWLIVSALFLPRVRAATMWNGILVGFAMVLIALSSTARDLRRHGAADL